MITVILTIVSVLLFLSIVATSILFWMSFAISERVRKLEDIIIEVNSSSKREQPPTKFEDQIASGLMKGMQQMREDDQRQMQLIELARRAQRQPAAVLNHTSAMPDTFDTNGDLIPQNLNQDEREVLKTFYGNQ